ncbi:IS3 family transposase [uncultured Ilyobacter sp.]|uniref:IS3 family transposase n=1 Tax=uncultured Ilyobacter sp. TaxID=544433 RepID=UPI0029F5B43A|nr:IS3 family transposase [uncultured Ilyobacter sp.]
MFVEIHRDVHSISQICRALEVSRNGFNKFQNNKTTERKKKDQGILDSILEVRKNRHKRSYGAPRLKVELKDEYGIITSERRINRIMKENDISVNSTKKFKTGKEMSKRENITGNIVKRKFKVGRKNEVWVTDITYIWTSEGWLYLSTIMDLFSRRIIAYDIGKRMTSELVIDTLTRSFLLEEPEEELIVHSDQGSQYSSREYSNLVKKLGLIQSMSRRGNCYDNAVIESFHASLKKEMVYVEGLVTKRYMKAMVFDYIEFYNKERRHSFLGNISPVEFEKIQKKLVLG